jgi:hypothetical protein
MTAKAKTLICFAELAQCKALYTPDRTLTQSNGTWIEAA